MKEGKNLPGFNKSNDKAKLRPRKPCHFPTSQSTKQKKWIWAANLSRKSHSCGSNKRLKEIRKDFLPLCEHLFGDLFHSSQQVDQKESKKAPKWLKLLLFLPSASPLKEAKLTDFPVNQVQRGQKLCLKHRTKDCVEGSTSCRLRGSESGVPGFPPISRHKESQWVRFEK